MSDSSPLQVITVLGPIAPEAIGVTLSHDHVLIDAFGLFGDSSYAWILDDEDVMGRELERYRDAGGATMTNVSSAETAERPTEFVDRTRK